MDTHPSVADAFTRSRAGKTELTAWSGASRTSRRHGARVRRQAPAVSTDRLIFGRRAGILNELLPQLCVVEELVLQTVDGGSEFLEDCPCQTLVLLRCQTLLDITKDRAGLGVACPATVRQEFADAHRQQEAYTRSLPTACALSNRGKSVRSDSIPQNLDNEGVESEVSLLCLLHNLFLQFRREPDKDGRRLACDAHSRMLARNACNGIRRVLAQGACTKRLRVLACVACSEMQTLLARVVTCHEEVPCGGEECEDGT